ncbi:mannose-6-phosphate isomerase, class I [Kitasatospora purpeofusca]|uniref:mannose-6-phosphate isomerase, class I n=1 Tax=Kitasatospora purpeofusca TaxID=67352 RepID=UPI002A5A5C6B|nr:mannose-6-phosphate isomerase, class I [Kitasatospora purpeofusca]MDY0815308.1 mannose-6-phosphate isomerase, class I [Kitasatospora purpeofusca]
MPLFAPLTNPVRPYAWGSVTAIPALTGTAPTGAPQAELWLGAHPSAPSLLDDGHGPRPLDELIAEAPEELLGAATVRRFGPRLPFLFKVLAAERALSLQVHPTRAQAEAGFAAEEALGVPPDAPERVYKDRGHKPELLCALGDFEALCGFRPTAATAALLDRLAVPALAGWASTLRARPAAEVLPALLRQALGGGGTGGPADTAVLTEVTAALERIAVSGGPFAAACTAYARAARDYPGDPGLLAALLLNHVRLRPGQALHLDAGVPHAYLHGLGVELMANSDNVLRCGLTAKYIDVPGLLAVTVPEAVEPVVLTAAPAAGGDPAEARFPSLAAEFRLSRLRLADPGVRIDRADAPQILLCTAGEARLSAPDGSALRLARGGSAYLPPTTVPVRLDGPGAELHRATVG